MAGARRFSTSRGASNRPGVSCDILNRQVTISLHAYFLDEGADRSRWIIAT